MNINMFIDLFSAMIGPTIIPIVNYMGSEMIVMPLIVMGVLLTFGGSASLFLPETKNKPLPQTIHESDLIPLEFDPFNFLRKPVSDDKIFHVCDVCKLEIRNSN